VCVHSHAAIYRMLVLCLYGHYEADQFVHKQHTPTQVIGEHDKAVKAVCWQKDLGCCVSGSWDKTMKVCACVLCAFVRVPAGVGCA